MESQRDVGLTVKQCLAVGSGATVGLTGIELLGVACAGMFTDALSQMNGKMVLAAIGATVAVGLTTSGWLLFSQMRRDIYGPSPAYLPPENEPNRRHPPMPWNQAEEDLGRSPMVMHTTASTPPTHTTARVSRKGRRARVRAFLTICAAGDTSEAAFKRQTTMTPQTVRAWRDALLLADWAEWRNPLATENPSYRPQGWRLRDDVQVEQIMTNLDLTTSLPTLRTR